MGLCAWHGQVDRRRQIPFHEEGATQAVVHHNLREAVCTGTKNCRAGVCRQELGDVVESRCR